MRRQEGGGRQERGNEENRRRKGRRRGEEERKWKVGGGRWRMGMLNNSVYSEAYLIIVAVTVVALQ